MANLLDELNVRFSLSQGGFGEAGFGGGMKVLGAEDVDTCSEMFVSAGSRGVGIFA